MSEHVTCGTSHFAYHMLKAHVRKCASGVRAFGMAGMPVRHIVAVVGHSVINGDMHAACMMRLWCRLRRTHVACPSCIGKLTMNYHDELFSCWIEVVVPLCMTDWADRDVPVEYALRMHAMQADHHLLDEPMFRIRRTFIAELPS